MENPEKLKIEIYQRNNSPPIIEHVFKSMKRRNALEEPDFVEYTGNLSKPDEQILLSRPQIAWLDNKEGDKIGEILYRKVPDSEEGMRAHTRPGIEIRVTYEIIK